MLTYIIIGIIVILSFIVFIFYSIKSKIKIQMIKISESINNIDILLENKLHILNKISKILNKNIEDKTIEKLIKSISKNANTFELDKNLFDIGKSLTELIDDKNIIFNDDDNELIIKLENNDLELKAIKLYYNNNVEQYNKLCTNFLGKILRIFDHYEKKETFILESIIPFEILKK